MADENNTTETPETETPEAEINGKRCNRKTCHKVMLGVGAAALVGVAAYAGAAHSSGWGHGYGHDGGKRGHMMAMFQEFDADDDGRVTQSEMDAARAMRFSNADDDNSTSISIDEFQNMWMDFMRPRMVDKFQMLDDDGNGEISEDEFAAPFRMALRHMDRNDDGAISMKEMKRKRHWHDDDDDDDDYDRDDNDRDDDRDDD